ncbi:hypothetical protein BDR03DRAFT_1068055 [Suillus americanus]|nr:hypothetical protein BDR03DRAFT_1068055 [Suillus americanus]
MTNLNYTGWFQLPPNLMKLFRLMAMTRPNHKLIAQICSSHRVSIQQNHLLQRLCHSSIFVMNSSPHSHITISVSVL